MQATVLDWLTSVGTILAFSLALYLALREAHLRNIATRDDEMRQARLIVVGAPVSRLSPGHETMAIFVRVFNYSEQPIQDLVVGLPVGRVQRGDDDHDEHAHEHEEPGPDHRHAWVAKKVTQLDDSAEVGVTADLEVSYIQFDFLGPKEEEEAKFPYPPGKGRVVSESPAIWFLDANGRRWFRVPELIEPRRIFDYVPPFLPDHVRAQILASRTRTRPPSWRYLIPKFTAWAHRFNQQGPPGR